MSYIQLSILNCPPVKTPPTHVPLLVGSQCDAPPTTPSYLVRVLLRHSVVVDSPKQIVISHTRLFTIRFGTSVPKSKSGSYISLFVLELPLPNRKAEVKFHYLFWNCRSQIENRKLIGQNKLSLAVRCTFPPFRRRRQSKTNCH